MAWTVSSHRSCQRLAAEGFMALPRGPLPGFGLTADHIDFLRGIVKVDRQAVALAKEPIRFGPPKRPGSYREIPVARDMIEALSAHSEPNAADKTGRGGIRPDQRLKVRRVGL